MLRRLLLATRRVILPWLTLLLLATVMVGQPTVTLTVSSGPPTTKLLVSGTGFDPYSAVDIYFDTKDEVLAVTDGNVVFGKIGITVPGSAKPGGHWVIGVERYKGLAGQSRFLVVTNWSQFQFAPDHSGVNLYENVLNPSNVRRLALQWSYTNTTGSNVAVSPAVTKDIVYFGSYNNNFYALNASSGALLWKYTTGDSVFSSPAVADGMVFFGSDDYSLYALNSMTGAKVWNYATGGYVTSSPAVVNEIVYFGSFDQNIYAIRVGAGTRLWQYTTGGLVNSSPAVANGIVYVGSFDSNVYALNANDGGVVWKYSTGAAVESSPTIANGVVFVGSNDHNVYALSASNGLKLWSYYAGESIGGISSPTVANGAVYVTSYDGYVHALNASTGNLLWKRKVEPYELSESPIVANGVLYIGTGEGGDGGSLFALDAKTGALLLAYSMGFDGLWSPVVVNGMVYVGSLYGSLYGFGLAEADSAESPPDPQTLVPDLTLKSTGPN